MPTNTIAEAVVEVAVVLPRDLLASLGVTEENAPAQAREWIALELFREGHISSGRAAELVGTSKEEFWRTLAERGVPYFDLTPEELESDIAVAEDLIRSAR